MSSLAQGTRMYQLPANRINGPKHRTTTSYGEVDEYFHAFINSALDGGEWSTLCSRYPLEGMRPAGPQNRSGCSDEEKKPYPVSSQPSIHPRRSTRINSCSWYSVDMELFYGHTERNDIVLLTWNTLVRVFHFVSERGLSNCIQAADSDRVPDCFMRKLFHMLHLLIAYLSLLSTASLGRSITDFYFE